MKFAIVELKYVPKKFFIVRTDWIKDFKGKYSNVLAVLCFISTDLSDEPNFLKNYCETYEGATGVYKVFIRKITEAAIEYQQSQKTKRTTSVPNKYRVPQNTDSELNAEDKKQKRIEKRTQKLSQESAAIKNSSHLAELIKSDKISPETDSDSDFDNEETLDQEVCSSSFTAETIQKSTVSECAISSQIKMTITDEPSKVVQKSSSNFEKKKDPSNVVNSNKKVWQGTANQKCPLSIRNKKEQNQLNVVNQEQKEKNSLPLSSTYIEPNRRNVEFTGATKILSSSSSVCNKKEMNPPIVLNPKRKEQNSVRLAVAKPIHNKVVALDTASKILPSLSSVINKTQTSQTKIVYIKQQNQIASKITNDGKPFQNIVLKGLDAANTECSSSVINENPENPEDDANTSSATSSIVKGSKRSANSSEKITAKKQKVDTASKGSTLTVEQKVGQCKTIKTLEEENAHLKSHIEILAERNEALQKALVVCTKCIPQPLKFKEKDEGRLYDCGLYFDKGQCAILDNITDDRQFCNSLTLAVFGSEILKLSSVTGSVSNRTKAPAKPPLDETGLQFIYDMMAIRTKYSPHYHPYKINKIIGKKIANLLAGESEPTRPRKKYAKPKKVDGEEENGGDCNDENDDEKTNQERNIDDTHDDGSIEADGNNEHNEEEEENELCMIDEEERNQEGDEQVNGLGDAFHESDKASTENMRLVHDADDTYYVLNMPSLFNEYILNDL